MKNKIQVLDSILHLGAAEKEQRAAFIVSHSPRNRPILTLSQRDERVIVVWSDAVDDIISSVLDIEARLLKLVWKQRPGAATPGSLTRASVFPSQSRTSLAIKKLADIELAEKSVDASSPDVLSVTKDRELEQGLKVIPRPTRILAPIYIGLATALSACEFSLTLSSQAPY